MELYNGRQDPDRWDRPDRRDSAYYLLGAGDGLGGAEGHRLGIGASPWAIAALFFNLIAVIALTSMPVSAGPAQSAAI
ncbi:MAG: hypothetical protein LKH04_07615 [Lachnospiraceae bacterium]|jgi:hypothetical protein|nr:hypothetical protein [Lachnospiraceae bacterium]MCI1424148.1 hypothetical protein [Lachnospiraceae bacterium]MCI1452982.1 hypothetical protein [Lachnospiraceae bacterium]MDD5848484.1 hypothetical protein [Bacillota bacterium]